MSIAGRPTPSPRQLNSALVSVALFMCSHLVLTCWWASKVDTLLTVVQRDLSEVIQELKGMRRDFISRDELRRELEVAERERAALRDQLKQVERKTP